MKICRAVYTKQILDISSKVQKQKQEVKKILSDTRVIQKEINTLTGKLQRIFAVVEDASYKAANSNELARPIYRSVVAIHDEFQALVDITRETGIIQREIADLQQQLNSEKSKNIEDNLRKLQEDLNNLKIENANLKQKLM
ncbi:Coiled-coil domain-containing protein 22 [Armadillidium vulgare]|nr:Coiled-coil domain-containing protein 22 [Armadillidium vulgare]RXG67633.1 Coiled-coil domain-containing protein 22 [Armadillidium vulgare]